MKTVIVTGASSGIGKEIAKHFSQQGWKVLLLARRAEVLQELAGQLQNAEAFPLDLTKPEDIKGFAEKISSYSVDALINNAGVFVSQSIEEDDDEAWETHFQSNLMSAVRLTRALWPQLKQSKACVLNVSSTLGLRPIANTASYSALKAAMNNWTQCLAIEGAAFGIRANALCPGIIDTPIHFYVESEDPKHQEIYKSVQAAQPLGRTGQPQDIAFMAFQFCQPQAQWTTGALLNVDGGILLNS